MAYSPRSIARVAIQVPVDSAAGASQAQQCGLFFFATDKAAATVETAGFFNDSRAFVRKGDVIIASMANGGTPVVKTYVVTAVPLTGNVTIALQTATAG